MSEAKHPPACVNCSWHEQIANIGHVCTVPLLRIQPRIDAQLARGPNGACGPEGKLFEKLRIFRPGRRRNA